MIEITERAIGATLEATIIAHELGQSREFQLGTEEKARREKPILYDYINSGVGTLQKVRGEKGKLIRAGYRSGAYLTFRMIELQLSLNQKQSPDITQEDIEKANEGVEVITRMEISDIPLAKIAMIRNENTEFGNYVTKYIEHQAPHEMIARGFALGVITTYSAYESAFNRESG